jgi:hypothetical protein
MRSGLILEARAFSGNSFEHPVALWESVETLTDRGSGTYTLGR